MAASAAHEPGKRMLATPVARAADRLVVAAVPQLVADKPQLRTQVVHGFKITSFVLGPRLGGSRAVPDEDTLVDGVREQIADGGGTPVPTIGGSGFPPRWHTTLVELTLSAPVEF